MCTIPNSVPTVGKCLSKYTSVQQFVLNPRILYEPNLQLVPNKVSDLNNFGFYHVSHWLRFRFTYTQQKIKA